MLAVFTRIIKWFGASEQRELEAYIKSKSPAHEGDVERLIIEYYKRTRGYF